MYGFGSRLLHRLALGSEAILEASFDLERRLCPEAAGKSAEANHVFVSGLARAGTTMLLRALYDTNVFASLTYRDMPFVLAPNTWAKVTRRSRLQMDAAERAHGDGIKVDFDSPEALEEVFWRVFGGEYVRKDRLAPVELHDDVIDSFRAYVDLVNHRYDRQRYLSKNNNNILRLGVLSRAFPNAAILLPFRDPVRHAQSLLTQHNRFIEQCRHDPFTQRYMTWLAHHEFGEDHRPFEWGAAVSGEYRPTELSYWLAQWIGVYRFLMTQISENDERRVFVCYELLCERSLDVWSGICKLLDIPLRREAVNGFEVRHRPTAETGESVLCDEAYALYEILKNRSSDRLLP